MRWITSWSVHVDPTSDNKKRSLNSFISCQFWQSLNTSSEFDNQLFSVTFSSRPPLWEDDNTNDAIMIHVDQTRESSAAVRRYWTHQILISQTESLWMWTGNVEPVCSYCTSKHASISDICLNTVKTNDYKCPQCVRVSSVRWRVRLITRTHSLFGSHMWGSRVSGFISTHKSYTWPLCLTPVPVS